MKSLKLWNKYSKLLQNSKKLAEKTNDIYNKNKIEEYFNKLFLKYILVKVWICINLENKDNS